MGVFAARRPFRPNPIGLTCVKLERVELTENDAQGGFIDETPWQELTVHCPAKLLQAIPEEKREGLLEVLGQDPRRAGSKHEPERTYHLAYAGFDIAFTVDDTNLHVQRIAPALA